MPKGLVANVTGFKKSNYGAGQVTDHGHNAIRGKLGSCHNVYQLVMLPALFVGRGSQVGG